MFPLRLFKTIVLSCSLAAPALAASWESEASFSGVADSKFKGKSFRGDVSELDYGVRAVASAQFGGGPLFRMGVEWQRYDFGLPRRAPLPDTMQSLALILGADFQLAKHGCSGSKRLRDFTTEARHFARMALTCPFCLAGRTL